MYLADRLPLPESWRGFDSTLIPRFHSDPLNQKLQKLNSVPVWHRRLWCSLVSAGHWLAPVQLTSGNQARWPSWGPRGWVRLCDWFWPLSCEWRGPASAPDWALNGQSKRVPGCLFPLALGSPTLGSSGDHQEQSTMPTCNAPGA